MKSSKDEKYFVELLVKAYDGQISPDEARILNEYIKTDADAVDCYIEFFDAVSGLIEMESVKGETLETESREVDYFLKALAEVEKTAPAVKVPKEEPERKLVQNGFIPPREKRKVSKFNIVFLALNAAAILFVVLFLKFAPTKSGVEVATLTDSIDAKWANVTDSMDEGARLVTGRDTLILQKGLAELLFDNNAKVVIEGPAEFELLAEDRIDLRYGRIYATAPQEAIGFTVVTPTSRIIDLGTEFGVQADVFGDVSLHVIKGKTTLIAGQKSNKVNLEVAAGQAKKVVAVTQEVSDIPCQTGLFVRDINSDQKFIWKGQTELSLASIFTGKEVFQEESSFIGLNPVNGKYTTTLSSRRRKTTASYNLIKDSGYIDGVFVPDGGLGPVQITSEGHTFDCPDTSGHITYGIAAFKKPVDDQSVGIPPVLIDGEEVDNEPVISLHSNAGITFDLRSIRELTQLNLNGFRALGVSLENTKHDLDFFVLVDGQIKYEKRFVTGSKPHSFNIEFKTENRFLTLIVTDGYQYDNNEGSFSNDHFYLVDPTLIVSE